MQIAFYYFLVLVVLALLSVAGYRVVRMTLENLKTDL